MMPQGASLKSEETESQAEKEVIPENEIKIIFEEDSPDEFFSKAVDLAVSDPMKFANTYKEFFKGEDFPNKVPDGRLNALRIFAWSFVDTDNEPEPEKQKEELLQNLKETRRFDDLMECRKKEVKASSEIILEELEIQGHGDPLSEREIEELVKTLQSNISQENSQSWFYLECYYLHEHDGLDMPTSLASRERDSNIDLNQRLQEITESPEESKQVLDMVSKKIGMIIASSNDQEIVAKANQENLNALPACVLTEGDLLHGGSIIDLDQIRKAGFLCREIVNPAYAEKSMQNNWASVSFSRQKNGVNTEKEIKNPLIRLLSENSFFGQYQGNVASDYGAHDESVKHYLRTGEKRDKGSNEEELEERHLRLHDIRTAGDKAMTYILREQNDSYAQGANVRASRSDEYCVGIGVPSTEIKGVIVDASSEEAIKKVLSKLAEFPFFIPAYDSETGVLLNEKMKELYK